MPLQTEKGTYVNGGTTGNVVENLIWNNRKTSIGHNSLPGGAPTAEDQEKFFPTVIKQIML